MKIKGSSLFLIFTLLLGIAFLFMSLPLTTREDKVAPLLFSIALIILAVIEVIRTLTRGDADEAKGLESRGPQSAQVTISLDRIKGILAWMGAPILGIYLLGFIVTIPLFIVAYMKIHKESWLLSIIIAAFTTAFFVVVCEDILQIHFYKGVVFELLE